MLKVKIVPQSKVASEKGILALLQRKQGGQYLNLFTSFLKYTLSILNVLTIIRMIFIGHFGN